jgi:hypothetical protein
MTIRKNISSLISLALLLFSCLLFSNLSHAAESKSDEEIIGDMVIAYLDWVDECDIALSFGGSSASGDLDFIKNRQYGYFKTGISCFYSNMETDLFLFDADIITGSRTFLPWCTCEVGLSFVYGIEKQNSHSDDLGAIALSGQASYTFPEQVIPIPLKISGQVMYSSDAVSFWDMKQLFAVISRIEVPFAKSTSLLLEHHFYDIKTSETSRRDYNINVFQLGLAFHF